MKKSQRLLLALSCALLLALPLTTAFVQIKDTTPENPKTEEKAAPTKWFTDIKKATEESQKTKKPLLLDFTGSDWCPPCKALEKTVFESSEFKKYAETDLVLMRVDFPRQGKQTEEEKKQNKDLSKKYKIEGYPTVIVLDAKGQILDKKVGYSRETAESYVKWLKSLKEKGKEKEKGKKEQP